MNLSDLTLLELKEVAKSIVGFSVSGNIGETKLREKLTAFIEENPDCLSEDEPEIDFNEDLLDGLETPEEKPPKELAGVKIKSAYKRGKRMTSFGMVDLGEDGKAIVSKECAEMLCSLKGYEKC